MESLMIVKFGLNSKGKREKWPTVERKMKYLAFDSPSQEIKISGIITIKIAFSWTCQPNMKDVKAQITNGLTKLPKFPLNFPKHNLTRQGVIARSVIANVTMG
jgi:hypothetical protein